MIPSVLPLHALARRLPVRTLHMCLHLYELLGERQDEHHCVFADSLLVHSFNVASWNLSPGRRFEIQVLVPCPQALHYLAQGSRGKNLVINRLSMRGASMTIWSTGKSRGKNLVIQRLSMRNKRIHILNFGQVSVGYTRAVIPVWSLDGAATGGKNSMQILRASGAKEHNRFVSGVKLKAGDRVLIETAHGGNAN